MKEVQRIGITDFVVLVTEDIWIWSDVKVYWNCLDKKCHMYKTGIGGKIRNNKGCLICSNGQICLTDQCNSLQYHCSENIKTQWNEEKNGPMTKYFPKSDVKVYWNCPVKKCHIYKTMIGDKVRKETLCPICQDRQICLTDQCNSLYYACYDLLKKEWDEKTNSSMKKYFPTSSKKVQWVCSKDSHHIWQATISNRNGNNTTCGICNNSVICQVDFCNSLYGKCSKILKKDWKGDIKEMKKYFPNSHKKVQWICSKKNCHQWYIAIRNRIKGYGCPICSNKKICPTD